MPGETTMLRVIALLYCLSINLTSQASTIDTPYIAFSNPQSSGEIRVNIEQYKPQGQAFARFEINLGDGSAIVRNSKDIYHTYTNTGTYTVIIKTWDRKRVLTTYQKNITINLDEILYDNANSMILSLSSIEQNSYAFNMNSEQIANIYKVTLTRKPESSNIYNCTLNPTLNKISIFKSNEINCNTQKLERLIAVDSVNLLEFLGSSANSTRALYSFEMHAVRFGLPDSEPPVITSNIASNQLTRQSAVSINITDISSVTTYVWNNQQQLLMQTTQKNFTINLAEGENNFILQSIDSIGNSSEYIYLQNIIRDTEPAVLSSDVEFVYYAQSLPESYLFTFISNEPLQSLYLNGQPLTMVGLNTYMGSYTAENEDLQILTLQGFDLAGNETQQTLQFYLFVDGVPPEITTNEIPVRITEQDTVHFQVHVSDSTNTETKFYIDDLLHFTTTMPNFDYIVSFGWNETKTVRIVSTDQVGNTSEKTFTIVRDNIPLEILITSPESGAILTGPIIDVRAMVSKPIVSARVNGIPVSIDDTYYINTVLQQNTDGPYTITIDVTDLYGDAATQSVTIQISRPQVPFGWNYQECTGAE